VGQDKKISKSMGNWASIIQIIVKKNKSATKIHIYDIERNKILKINRKNTGYMLEC